jgi:alpha/beta superfamily hydrolase
LRSLADSLSEQGYPTLRLQYLGTGDSCEPNGDDCWAEWQQNIHDGAEWLRKNVGAQRIALCGFRFGALLAATVAANRTDIAGLILLAPVLRGGSYVRQLVMETSSPPDAYVDLVRFRLSPRTIRLLNQVELRKISLPATCKVGVFAPTRSAAWSDCEAVWRKGGVEVTSHDFSGLEPMLRPTFAIHEKSSVVDPVVTWLRRSAPTNSWKPTEICAVESMEITPEGCIETPVFFGPTNGLFGILCRPGVAKSRIVVVMGNSSGDPHCAATTVNLARHLAAGGVASLRIDFAGIGDSGPVSGHGHVFETDRTADFSAAINALEVLGYRGFAVQGLCSGAYHAYHATLADRRITYSLLLNLPFFKWIVGFPVEQLIFDIRKPSYFVQSMHTKVFWETLYYKLRRGDLNIRRRFAWLESKLRQLPGFARHSTDPIELSKRAQMLFLAGEGDIGIELLKREFGSRTAPPGVKVAIVPGLDHAMTRRDMRKIVADQIVAFLETADAAKHVPELGEGLVMSPMRHVSARSGPIVPNSLIPS